MRSLAISIYLLLCIFLSVNAQEARTTLFGHNDALLYGRYWSDSPQGRKGKKEKYLRPDVYQVCKAYPGLLSTDLDGLELGRTVYWIDHHRVHRCRSGQDDAGMREYGAAGA